MLFAAMDETTTQVVQHVTSNGGFQLGDWGAPAAVGVLFAIMSSLATWIFTRGGKEAVLKEQVRVAEATLLAASNRADRAEASNASLLEKLQTHMTSDAAAFAKLEALTAEATRNGAASEQRLTSAIEKLVERIDAMAGRFDQLIQNQATILATQAAQAGASVEAAKPIIVTKRKVG